MKALKTLAILCIAVLAMPMLANAEIYKWKDKNGVTRYSDTPPGASANVDTLKGSNKAKQQKPKETSQPATQKNAIEDASSSNREEAARLRARNAETEKRNKLEKEKMAKLNAENCKAAKSNYTTFSQGGRIYKTNENGDREYYSDDELKSQKAKAQAEVRKFCK